MNTLSRQHLVRKLAVALGAALGLGSLSATAARCRKKSDRCDRGNQCCSKRCKRGFCYPKRRK